MAPVLGHSFLKLQHIRHEHWPYHLISWETILHPVKLKDDPELLWLKKCLHRWQIFKIQETDLIFVVS